MAAIQRYFQGGPNKKDTESHWRSTILAKRKSCFSMRSRADWILRLNADGPQKPLRQRPEFSVASKQCLKMQDAHLAETQQSLRRQRQDQQFEGRGDFDYYVDRKTGWR